MVRVVPRASRSEFAGEHDGALRVRIAAPPVDGAANDELIVMIARALKVPRQAVEIISGHSAKARCPGFRQQLRGVHQFGEGRFTLSRRR